MTVDLSKLAFLSSENYMKRRKQFYRYQDVTLAAYASQTLSFGHNVLGIPDYDVQCELTNDQTIWTGNIVEVGMDFSPTFPQFSAWVTGVTLNVLVKNNSGSSITVRVWYLVYQDYA